jgi:hypothetical protein
MANHFVEFFSVQIREERDFRKFLIRRLGLCRYPRRDTPPGIEVSQLLVVPLFRRVNAEDNFVEGDGLDEETLLDILTASTY